MEEHQLREEMTDSGQNSVAVRAFEAIRARSDGLARLQGLYDGTYGMAYDTGEKLAGAWQRSGGNIGSFAYEMQWV